MDLCVVAHKGAGESKGVNEALIGNSSCMEEVSQRHVGGIKESANVRRMLVRADAGG